MFLYTTDDKSLESPILSSYADVTYHERYEEEESEGTFDHTWERWDD